MHHPLAVLLVAWCTVSVLAGFGYHAIRTASIRRYRAGDARHRAELAQRRADESWQKVAAAFRAADADFDSAGIPRSMPDFPAPSATDTYREPM